MHSRPEARPASRSRPPLRAPHATVLAATLSLAACGGGSSGGPDTGAPDIGDAVGPPAGADDDPAGVGRPGDGGPEVLPGRDDRAGLLVRFPAGREPGTLSSLWSADVEIFQIARRPDTTGDIEVALALSALPLGFSFEESIAHRTPRLDFCQTRDLDAPVDDGGDASGGDDDGLDVFGGDALTLTSAGGTWLSVPFDPVESLYVADNAFPGPAPDDLALSIPGSPFPAIDAVPLGVPAAPERLSPSFGEQVTAATEYRWAGAREGDGTIMRIVFLNDVGDEFRGFPARCIVRDDGAFELPADVFATLAPLPGRTTVRYVRERRLLEFRDDVVVFQSASIADD